MWTKLATNIHHVNGNLLKKNFQCQKSKFKVTCDVQMCECCDGGGRYGVADQLLHHGVGLDSDLLPLLCRHRRSSLTTSVRLHIFRFGFRFIELVARRLKINKLIANNTAKQYNTDIRYVYWDMAAEKAGLSQHTYTYIKYINDT